MDTPQIDLDKIFQDAKIGNRLVKLINKLNESKELMADIAEMILISGDLHPELYSITPSVLFNLCRSVATLNFEAGRLYGRIELVNETLDKVGKT